MEPMMPEGNRRLEELAVELVAESHSLSASVASETRRSLAGLVRSMNAYYTNFIEGQHTLPVDINRALAVEYPVSSEQRDLQVLARVHIMVEQELEEELRRDPHRRITSSEYIAGIHNRFYSQLPERFLRVRSRSGRELPVVPGALRTEDVTVGRHVPPPSGSLPALLERFSEGYDPVRHGPIQRIIAAMASHHRLAWIHPFLDGNGRVTRLFTQSMLIRAGLDSHGLWTISRGLARNKGEYMARLEAADATRHSDLDGRGNLSSSALAAFTEFMLKVSLDQVRFMKSLFEFETVLDRIERYVELMAQRGQLLPTTTGILQQAYLRGELARNEALRLTGLPERSARRYLSKLVTMGLLTSSSSRAPYRMMFPSQIVPRLFPHLYPADVETSLLERG
jgi:Fic family protein